MSFMRKYIHFAKAIKPQLTQEAIDIIAEEYSKLRTYDSSQNDLCRTQPITARTLETMIRLSTAHARARLSKSIDAVDAKAAVEMVQFSHFQKVLEKPRKRKRRVEDGDDDDDHDEDDEEDEEIDDGDVYEFRPEEKKVHRSVKTHESMDVDQPADADTSLTTTIEEMKSESPKSSSPIELTDARLKEFRQFLFKIFNEQKTSNLTKDIVHQRCREEAENEGKLNFRREEIDSALAKMNDLNQIFISNDMIILI